MCMICCTHDTQQMHSLCTFSAKRFAHRVHPSTSRYGKPRTGMECITWCVVHAATFFTHKLALKIPFPPLEGIRMFFFSHHRYLRQDRDAQRSISRTQKTSVKSNLVQTAVKDVCLHMCLKWCRSLFLCLPVCGWSNMCIASKDFGMGFDLYLTCVYGRFGHGASFCFY